MIFEPPIFSLGTIVPAERGTKSSGPLSPTIEGRPTGGVPPSAKPKRPPINPPIPPPLPPLALLPKLSAKPLNKLSNTFGQDFTLQLLQSDNPAEVIAEYQKIYDELLKKSLPTNKKEEDKDDIIDLTPKT